MDIINLLERYKAKISQYDQKAWEHNTEMQILSQLEVRPIKINKRPDSELLDVDLIRGSVFDKAKVECRLSVIVARGLLRTFLMPFYLLWWRRHTGTLVAVAALAVYAMLLGHVTLILCHASPNGRGSLGDVAWPGLVMLAVGLLQFYVTTTVDIADDALALKAPISSPPPSALPPLYMPTDNPAADPASVGLQPPPVIPIDEQTAVPAPRPLPDILTDEPAADSAAAAAAAPQLDIPIDEPNSTRRPTDESDDPDDLDSWPHLAASIPKAAADLQTCSSGTTAISIGLRISGSSNSPELASFPCSGAVVEECDPAIGCFGSNLNNAAQPTREVANLQPLESKYFSSFDNAFDRMDSRLSDTEQLESDLTGADASTASDIEIVDAAESLAADGVFGGHVVEQLTAWSKSQLDKHSSRAIYCFVWPPSSDGGGGGGGGSSEQQQRLWQPATSHRKRRPAPRKVQLTMLDIGWRIIQAVERAPSWGHRNSLAHVLLPAALSAIVPIYLSTSRDRPHWDGGADPLACLRLALAVLSRCGIYFALYFLLCVADRTLWQRYLFAKHYRFLTSSRRAEKYRVPHFRLNKPRNINVWLSLRAYLRRRGPQRSLDAITNLAFYMFLSASCLLCWLLLYRTPQQLRSGTVFCDSLLAFACVGCFLLRYLDVGTRINKKFHDKPVLVTEQINLCLAMEAKPHHKATLQLASNMLKHTDDLLKCLDVPYRIGGVVVNPVFHNALKVFIMSSLSEILSKFVGFKLMLDRINIHPANW